MTVFNTYTNQYSLSKTLRFELKPIGATKNNLDEILKRDRWKAEAYKEIKPLINAVHRDYIEEKLFAPVDSKTAAGRIQSGSL